MSKIMHKSVNDIKRITKFWTVGKCCRNTFLQKPCEKYRPVFLLNINSKILKTGIYEALYRHFTKYLCANQHGFLGKRSTQRKILSFLKQIYEAIDYSVDNEVCAFYLVFSKIFDRVSYNELLKKRLILEL